MYAPKFYHHQEPSQLDGDDDQHQMVPSARKTPLSAGARKTPLSAGKDTGEGMNMERAKSFLAFFSKWVGFGTDKTMEDQQKNAKRVCIRNLVNRAPEEAVVKTEECYEIGSVSLIEHTVGMAACLADADCSDQAIYGFGNELFKVTRVPDRIDVEEEIGNGSFAKVYRGVDNLTKQQLAVKVFSASEIASKPRLQENLGREIECLRAITGHPNIVQFRGLMVTRDSICILTEYLEGEEFFRYISRGGPMSERAAKPLLHQLADTVEYLHDIGIVHRDLKLENLMLVKFRGELILKVIDFGLARDDANGVEVMMTRCGSQEYAAPEILLGGAYNPRLCDSWSFGVIMYTVLFGTLPFSTDSREGPSALAKKIVAGVYRMPEGIISAEATRLVRKLLEVRPEDRLSVSDAIGTSSFFM